jgi:hypothetical protein
LSHAAVSQSGRGQAEPRAAADLEFFNMAGLAIVRCLEMDVDVAVAGCEDTAMPGRMKTDDRSLGPHELEFDLDPLVHLDVVRGIADAVQDMEFDRA